jgi:hypothetical protein
MKNQNQKGFASIALVVVIVIATGAVGYFVLVKKSEPVAQQTMTPTKMPIVTLAPKNETASWETYRNEKYGFELKYPADWLTPILNDSTTSNGHPAVSLSFPRKNTDFYAVQMVNDTVFVSKGSVEKNVDAFINSPAYRGIKWGKEFLITNGRAFYYVNTGSKAGPSPTVYLVGPSGVWLMSSDLIEMQDTLLSIASTFKFTK